MSRKQILVLFFIGTVVAIVAVINLEHPGYMDAQYYFANGGQLADGQGFIEPFIWNYLNEPVSVSHPSHGYWQPFTSIVAAFSMRLFGDSFRAAQLPFILLTGFLPLLTALYSFAIHQDSRAAFLSGLLAAVPGYFLPFFLTTDTFILYAWIGTLFFWSLHAANQSPRTLTHIATGICIGLAHLSRADGLLLAIPFFYYVYPDRERFFKRIGLTMLGYLAVMAPWFLRNLGIYGSILPPGSQHALWLRSYEDLFRYPGSDLTPGFLLQAGFGEILDVRFAALWTNLQRVVAENGLIFLLPLMIIGVVRQWRLRIVRAAMLYLAVLILLMSFVFPFAGAQGGMFHSGAALMPTLWMLTPFGLRAAVAWIGDRRSWDISRATVNFGWISVVLAGILTTFIYLQRVYGFEHTGKAWDIDHTTYGEIGQELRSLEKKPQVVMVNNPPGFYVATGIPAIVVPSGGSDALHSALADYDVDYLLLDRNHPSGLSDLYSLAVNSEWLELVREIKLGPSGPILVFQVTPRLESE